MCFDVNREIVSNKQLANAAVGTPLSGIRREATKGG